MKPVVDRAALVALRTERGMTVEELAERAGYSARALQMLEQGKSGGRLRTLRDVAKALGVDLRALLARPAASPSAQPLPTTAGKPPSAFGREARQKLRELEQTRPPRPAITHKGVELPPLTAARFEVLVSSYKRHVGRRFWIDARLTDIHGVGDEEAASLGSENGVAVRYLAELEIVDGHALPVTLHALAVDVVDRVQDVPLGASARLIVSPRSSGAVNVTWFNYEQKRPFALEIVDLVEAAPAPKTKTRGR